MFLIVETFGRFKTLDDIKMICNSYVDLAKQYSTQFEDVLIFTTEFVYFVNEESFIKIEASVYSTSIKEANSLLGGILNNISISSGAWLNPHVRPD